MLQRRHVVLLALPMLGAAFLACSDPPSHPPPAADGAPRNVPSGGGQEGGVGDGGTDAGVAGDAGACNDLDLASSLLVDRIGVVGDPPVAVGGTIEDGVYGLTDFSVYVGAGGVAGPTGISARAALRFGGGKLDELYQYSGSGPATTRSLTSAFNATGSTLATTQLCPGTGGGASKQYSVNGAALVLTDLTTKEAFTFTKR